MDICSLIYFVAAPHPKKTVSKRAEVSGSHTNRKRRLENSSDEEDSRTSDKTLETIVKENSSNVIESKNSPKSNEASNEESVYLGTTATRESLIISPE